MFLIPLLFLAAMALVIVLLILAAGVVAGGCTGAALGGTLPLIFRRPAGGKGAPVRTAFGQVLRTTLGIVCGGLCGGLIGLGIAALGIWALIAAG